MKALLLALSVLLAVGAPAEAAGYWGRWRTARIVPWYGPGFYGNRTACGIRLTRYTRGVAHRTLNCGRLIQLKKDGVRVKARVIDRGPYPAKHLYDDMPLDLAPGTVKELLGIHATTHNVRWRVWHRR
jgi:rare lipoprotein A (peptidoglycan hydrolase)